MVDLLFALAQFVLMAINLVFALNGEKIMFHLMDTNQLLRLARDVDMGEYERAVVERLDDYDRRLKEIDDVLDNFYLHSDPSLLHYDLTQLDEQLNSYKLVNAELRAEIDGLKG